MKNSSKIVFSALLLLTLPFISFADMVVWTEGDYETGFGKSYPSSISELSTYNNVTVSIYEGGGVGKFYMYDDSEVTIYDDGSASISYLYLYGSNRAAFYGGDVDFLYIDSASTPEIYLNAYDVTFSSDRVTGYWYDVPLGLNSFSISLVDTDESALSYFHVIPEPASALMLIVGASLMAFRRRKTTL